MAQDPVFRLLYVSTATASAAMSLHETMRSILTVSDANNRRDGITGFLLSDGFRFVQLLEGAEPAVRSCFSRISNDGRNLNPAIREAAYANERLFPDWSMCGLNLSGRDNALLRPGHLGFDLFEASPGALLQHLKALVDRHGEDLLLAHASLLRSDR